MSYPLFCYGTLEVPGIFRKVTGTLLPSSAAELPGYACYQVIGAAYPAIIKQPDALTAGTLYTAVTPHLLARIDQYEGKMYTREQVQVHTEGTPAVSAWTYVIANRYRARLSSRRWDREKFRQQMAAAWLQSLR